MRFMSPLKPVRPTPARIRRMSCGPPQFSEDGRRGARRRGAQRRGRAPDTRTGRRDRRRRRSVRRLDGLLPSATGRARQARRRVRPWQLPRDVRRRNARRAQLVRRPRHPRGAVDDLGEPRHRSMGDIRRGMGPADEGAPVLQHRRLHLSAGAGGLHRENPGALEAAADSVRASESRGRRARLSPIRSGEDRVRACTTREPASCARGARAKWWPRRFASLAAKC